MMREWVYKNKKIFRKKIGECMKGVRKELKYDILKEKKCEGN